MRPLLWRILAGLLGVVALSHLISIGIWFNRFDADSNVALKGFVDDAVAAFERDLDGVDLGDDEAVDRAAESRGLVAHRAGPRGEGPPPPPPRALDHLVEKGGERWMVSPRFPGPRPPHPPAVIAQIVVSLLGVAAVAYALARPLVRDLGQLERTLDQLGGEDLGARAPVPASGPTRALALGLNRMAERVETLVKGQRQLFQAVSHDIRTPHARIRFRLEALLDADPAQKEALIEAIDKDLTEVDALVEELIHYLRYDVDKPATDAESWELGDVLREAAERARPFDPQVALDVVDPTAPFGVHIPRKWLLRAVTNLTTNAQRYANARVQISAGRRDGCAVVDVDDDGPGIPVADRQRFLEPFATGDVTRSRATGGVGLGLAIVARIAARTGGRLEIGDSPLGGARVSLIWPLG